MPTPGNYYGLQFDLCPTCFNNTRVIAVSKQLFASREEAEHHAPAFRASMLARILGNTQAPGLNLSTTEETSARVTVIDFIYTPPTGEPA